ncbi:serine hydroxymethyltransferase [bacterium (Candidatus Gribaldobacteria) CG07_land_8_20_14_0_80_33_18]|uniref:Serine hydroxymethyltransferase n=1 Tax=bacterium (Candidatus Gribaldobacteria) CG07_land_8_20_14_0_80_33_18 TaxID=2014272 RepID=A0A2M6Z4G0_9BACT|nr:MAG: serine hydroxymethyltransferase [bacterium (Candidatus Gribaldobacteria) CG10_big_fil_rev_8_21_14_0_10_33_41]PIU47225.1 MAG: serine hydroxymethyltransferase [bacterium (Candidatus Gribaldobacteria) CG07_land_8_20_14_0_80_33_18]
MEDKKIYNLIKKEIQRQREGLVLIPSENYASPAVLRCMGTPLSNKYSEGYPHKRYYSGNEYIDEIEDIAIERAKKLFKAEHANVQPHSGSQANAAVYLALLKPKDTVLAPSLFAGGHLTYGSPINFSGIIYNFIHYGVNPKTERYDFDEIEEKAKKYKPKLIVTGTTSYPRALNFKKFKEIADKIGAYLMADIAHIAGLIIAHCHSHPFPFCDVVTTTTHKTLRGPRGGLILSKKDLAEKIDKAVFPGIQGGPLDHVIAAKAVCFKEAMSESFKKYQKQIILNAQAMAQEFVKAGFRLVTGGTDNHLILIDISSFKIDSKRIQDELDKIGIYVNKNVIPFEKRTPFNPSGIRLGSPAITSRGFKEKEAGYTAQLVIKLIKNINNKKIKNQIKKEVKKLTQKFPIYEMDSFGSGFAR